MMEGLRVRLATLGDLLGHPRAWRGEINYLAYRARRAMRRGWPGRGSAGHGTAR